MCCHHWLGMATMVYGGTYHGALQFLQNTALPLAMQLDLEKTLDESLGEDTDRL